MACIALAWLMLVPNSIVITTAPTNRQVEELLWKEIRTIIAACRARGFMIGGNLLPSMPEFRIDNGWLMMGFATNEPVRMQGWHSKGGTLLIMDEAPGIPPEMWKAMLGMQTGTNDKMVAIGNPIEATGPFYNGFTKMKGVGKIAISALDIPNVIEGREVIPGLCTLEWAQEIAEEYGEESPVFVSRVLGDFPDQSDTTLVPLSWIVHSNNRWRDLIYPTEEITLGVDVARMGMDKTVLAASRGLKCMPLVKWGKKTTTATVGKIKQFLLDHKNVTQINVDADGLGAGVYDMLKEADLPVKEMRAGMTPVKEKNAKRFLNNRAMWLWTLRKGLDPEMGDNIALPPDDHLMAQLTGIMWEVPSHGRIQIESKEEMRKRGMRSPDEADAVALAYANSGFQGMFL